MSTLILQAGARLQTIMQFAAFMLLMTIFSAIAQSNSDLSYKNGFMHSSKDAECVDCHQSEVTKWHQADHFKSMDLPSQQTVIGNFNTQASHYDLKAKFWSEEGQYQVTLTEAGETTTYKVDYVFGYYPLQQYLTHIKDGHYQLLPFAWDDRTPEEGGQRWFHMYPDEPIKPADRLHWKTPIQNWNGMCADCHSDQLVRNYNSTTNSFNTTWKAINVGCLSCHGDITQQTPAQVKEKLQAAEQQKGFWTFKAGNTTAHWQGPKRDNQFTENCYACHSLRAPLTDGFMADEGYLNQFKPQLLEAPLYYPDGHIRDEVYVWGSFQQSKMFEAGVNCLDCHDSHSYKVRSQDNSLCYQCHLPTKYESEQHHHHEVGSEGARCVECHMPDSAFMVIDDRRDHSFRIPRPNNSLEHGTPNACTKCHDDKDDDWAAEWSQKWYGDLEESTGAVNFMRLQQGEDIGLTDALRLIADQQLPPIKRASALRLIPFTIQSPLNPAQLKPFVLSSEPLIRMAAAEASKAIVPGQRAKLIQDMLNDELRVVRVAAADALLDTTVDKEHLKAFNNAFNELVTANQASLWRGEGRTNQALLHTRRGEIEKAVENYIGSIKVDPYFPVAYVNLADLYRMNNQPKLAQQYYELGIKNLPKDASIRYAYGLHLIREGRTKQAAEQFERAVRYQPDNEQSFYVWLLTLDSLGQMDKALKLLMQRKQLEPLSPRLIEIGLEISTKAQKPDFYQRFLEP